MNSIKSRTGRPPVDGTASEVASRARVYVMLRTAHLERFKQMTSATVFYRSTRYDFDATVAGTGTPLVQSGRLGTLIALARGQFIAVELNEPLMTQQWTDLLCQIMVIRASDRIRRRRTRIGAYCLGLTDPVVKLKLRWRSPTKPTQVWAGAVLRLLVNQYDRLAFGTDSAYRFLEEYVGPDLLKGRSKLIPALPRACTCDSETNGRDPMRVLFVGAFSDRKGIRVLMAAWDLLKVSEPEAQLTIIGMGSLKDEVEAWADSRHDVRLSVDPPRAEIHSAFWRSHVLVLPSQRVGPWREQVGLPIVEGLAHGCEIVTTAETGLASWLSSNGHEVIYPTESPIQLARALARSVQRTRTAQEILFSLPAVDGRLEADEWLMEEG